MSLAAYISIVFPFPKIWIRFVIRNLQLPKLGYLDRQYLTQTLHEDGNDMNSSLVLLLQFNKWMDYVMAPKFEIAMTILYLHSSKWIKGSANLTLEICTRKQFGMKQASNTCNKCHIFDFSYVCRFTETKSVQMDTLWPLTAQMQLAVSLMVNPLCLIHFQYHITTSLLPWKSTQEDLPGCIISCSHHMDYAKRYARLRMPRTLPLKMVMWYKMSPDQRVIMVHRVISSGRINQVHASLYFVS